MIHVKVCGVMSVDDAIACVDLGASAIGVNFVAESPRRIGVEAARAIARAVGERALVVGVVADMSADAMKRLRDEAELGCLQLHGDEPPSDLEPLLPHAYKALRIATAEDAARASLYPGEHLLVDAKVHGARGGTGATFDWSLVTTIARARKLTLAGGLTPDNVEAAIAAVHPYCVDVASGVEVAGKPGTKDLAKVEAFVTASRRAR